MSGRIVDIDRAVGAILAQVEDLPREARVVALQRALAAETYRGEARDPLADLAADLAVDVQSYDCGCGTAHRWVRYTGRHRYALVTVAVTGDGDPWLRAEVFTEADDDAVADWDDTDPAEIAMWVRRQV